MLFSVVPVCVYSSQLVVLLLLTYSAVHPGVDSFKTSPFPLLLCRADEVELKIHVIAELSPVSVSIRLVMGIIKASRPHQYIM